MTHVCETCTAYKNFGEKCWFFWNEKKSCSQWKDEQGEPKFKTVHVAVARHV